jgi:sulfite reductase (NADPH) flavoprotein alpha-component
MNMMSPHIPLIPEDAPFTAEQRAWLNGFFAGIFGPSGTASGAAGSSMMSLATPQPASQPEPEEEFPWHDPALEMPERLALAEGKPLRRRMMAAMAQLDCGQCGYLCQTYAEAIAEGREESLSLCVPGGKPTSKMLKAIRAETSTAAPAVAVPVVMATPPKTAQRVHVLRSERLSGPGSAKDVRHVVIDLAESGLRYEPGDSLSLLPANDVVLVEACIAALDAEAATPVACPDGVTRPLAEALTRHVDIARPHDRTLDLLAMAAKTPRQAEALRRLADGDECEPTDPDLLDLLEAFPSARPTLGDLLKSLPPLKPRLYSIASSQALRKTEVHLCVSVVSSELRGRRRRGVASGFLGFDALTFGPIEASVQTSHFRLPENPQTPVIMCGPGTGIAPFRAFLQEREARGMKGPAWLFFGEQTAAEDFLFRGEMEAWLADGTLTRLDTAFSRDQAQKVYVQDRMRENGPELWRWFQEGAHFFVCGDATRMARDVDATLRQMAVTQGGLSESDAKDWILGLARQGRYKRDIY